MNREQRHMVHELAEAYGCETQSYDYEPNKNVVATAFRCVYGGVSWLSVFLSPSPSLYVSLFLSLSLSLHV